MFIFVLQFVIACSSPAQPLEGERWVIFPAEQARHQGIGDCFDQQATPIWERLDEYNRQYIGIIQDGKQIIYANYFCDSTDMDWRKDFVFVMDGGDCFFQFKYDVDSAEFFDLQVNGNA